MWAAFQGSFTRAAGSVLREPDAKALMRRAHPKYREILARVTEFDKGDRFLVNILSCAMKQLVRHLPAFNDDLIFFSIL